MSQSARGIRNPAAEQTLRTPSPPPGLMMADHFVEPYGYATWRANGTRDWLLTCTVGGMGRYGHSGGNFFCRAGDVVLLAPGTPHDYATAHADAPWEFFWAHFVPRPHWSPWLQLGTIDRGFFVIHIEDSAARERVAGRFTQLIADSRGLGAYREDLALSGLEEVLIIIARQHARTAEQRFDPRIEAVLQRLAARLDAPLRLDEVAATVALSPSRLAHLFKEQVGDSIGRWHMRLRLRHAARLLEFTTRSIAEIGRDVGFQSPFHFSHQFKLYYDESPQHYRSRATK